MEFLNINLDQTTDVWLATNEVKKSKTAVKRSQPFIHMVSLYFSKIDGRENFCLLQEKPYMKCDTGKV